MLWLTQLAQFGHSKITFYRFYSSYVVPLAKTNLEQYFTVVVASSTDERANPYFVYFCCAIGNTKLSKLLKARPWCHDEHAQSVFLMAPWIFKHALVERDILVLLLYDMLFPPLPADGAPGHFKILTSPVSHPLTCFLYIDIISNINT